MYFHLSCSRDTKLSNSQRELFTLRVSINLYARSVAILKQSLKKKLEDSWKSCSSLWRKLKGIILNEIQLFPNQLNVGVLANKIKASLQIPTFCAIWCHLKQTLLHILERACLKRGDTTEDSCIHCIWWSRFDLLLCLKEMKGTYQNVCYRLCRKI